MEIVNKIKRKLKSGSWYPFYNTFYERVPVSAKMILLESRSGKALESNILSLLKELNTPPYKAFKLILSVQGKMKENVENKLRYHNLHVDKIVQTGSLSYYYYLSKAGYLVNDTSFPGRFIKKDGQVYLNTWHGTPLKKMGRDNQEEVITMGNVLRNLLCSDYLVFPNAFMEKKMSGAYMLDNFYQGTILHEGYPRNDIFFSPEKGEKLKKEEGFSGKRLIAYLPTYRGNSLNVEEKGYLSDLVGFFKLWDKELKEDEVLLVKLHPFVNSGIDFTRYTHIRQFPEKWDTYEGLNACEVLITDYSSVMYDFACSRRKVILFTYDKEDYESARGLYDDVAEYPFDLTDTAQGVMDCLHREEVPDQAANDKFFKEYATYEDGQGASRICRRVFLGENCCREKHLDTSGKDNILIYAGDFRQNGITPALCSMLEKIDLTRHHYVLSFRMNSVKDRPECVNKIPKGAGVYPLSSEMNMDLLTALAHFLWMGLGSDNGWVKKRLDKAYKREWRKHFAGARFSQVVHYNGYEAYVNSLLKQAPCPRTIWVHSDMEQEIKLRHNQNLSVLREAYSTYDNVVTVSRDIRKPTARISGRKDNIRVIENCHDADRGRYRSTLPVSFDENTSSTVSLKKLRKVLDSDSTRFISIGRYSPEKGHERLIRAFNRYYEKHPDTWLIIIGGTGDLYEKTIRQAKESNAGSHIILIKSVSNPMPILKRCDLFLLSSYYEGLPVSLMEADSLGVPVLSCDINGSRGFLKEYGGLIVENSEEGLLHGMELFARGEVHPMNIDYEARNRRSIEAAEALFAGK